MKNGDPYNRTSLEVRILAHLNDSKHPITLDDLWQALPSEQKELITWAVFHFAKEGLVTLQKLSGGQLVTLLPQGKEILTTIYSGRVPCD